MILIPGALLAGTTQGSVTAIDYDNARNVVSGVTPTWQIENLKHNVGTLNRFVDNPDILPGSCRGIATRWNIGLLQGRNVSYFRKLLDKAAQKQCTIAFTREEELNADGAFNLTSVRPSKQ